MMAFSLIADLGGRGRGGLINAISYIANNFFNSHLQQPVAMPFLGNSAMALITRSYCYAGMDERK